MLVKGAFYILLGAAAYACMGAFVKFADGRLPNEELVFMRSSIGFLLVLPWVRKTTFKTTHIGNHFIRALAGFLNMSAFFLALRYIPLSTGVLLNNTMPLFLPFVFWVWKRKRISLSLLPGLIVGFIGVLVILQPGASIFELPALYALASGLFMAVSMTGLRTLSSTESNVTILAYYFGLSALFAAIPLIWTWQTPTSTLWLLLLGIGLFSALYQYLLTLGFRAAPATKVSPLISFAVIVSGFFDWIFWAKIPSVVSYVGMALVIVGATWCLVAKRAP